MGYLGITPLEYQFRDGANSHSHLGETISKWAGIGSRGALESEAAVKDIVEQPLSLNGDDLDFIENSLGNISTLRFFTHHTKRLDWLHWIEEKDPFKRLFSENVVPTESDWQLATWFARAFVCKHPDSALAVVRRKGGTITRVLWAAIAASFHTERADTSVVRKWVPLLIRYPTPAIGGDYLEYTLHRSIYPDDATSALLLFEYLTRPDVILEERFWPPPEENPGEEGVDVEVTTEADDTWVPGAWTSFFKPNLEFFFNKLLWIVTSHLQQAHLLLEAYEKVHQNWDPLSARRGLIESSGQGTPEKGIGILIDIARDLLEWAVINDDQSAEFLIHSWFASEVRILKRLAIFGVLKSGWDSDRKVNWILRNQLINAPGYKHELFLVLENAYRHASPANHEKVVARISITSEGEDTDPYEQFNLLYWLAKNAPDCELTQARLAEIQQAYPQFAAREHPDMDSWIGPVTSVELHSELTVEEILSKTAEELIDFVSTYEGSSVNPFRGESTAGLLKKITIAVTRDFEWSIGLAKSIAQKEQWDSDIWKSIVDGWQVSLKGEQWARVLEFLASHEELIGSALYNLSNLLKDGVEKPDRAIPGELVEQSLLVGQKLWEHCVASQNNRVQDAKDWLFLAINHPAGSIATFFLHTLSAQRAKTGKQWSGIPVAYKHVFSSMVSGDTYPAELARVVLASQLLFLFSSDEEWTVKFVVPLLNWSTDLRRALQAWHGFLVWGKWNESLLTYLMPCYEQAFTAVHSSFGELRDDFCSHLASIAVLSSINPVQHGWLNRFLVAVDAEEREMWAASVGGVLKGTTESSKAGIWNRWMMKYWRDRIQGVPVTLTAKEVGDMVHWSIQLEPVFDDVVATISDSPAPELKHSHIYYQLSHSTIGTNHPDATGRLLLYLLRAEQGPFWMCDYVEVVVNSIIATNLANKRNLLMTCDELGRLGCPSAAQLKKLISE